MRFLAVLIPCLAGCVFNPATGETELDRDAVHAKFVAIGDDLMDLAIIAEGAGDEQLAEDLRIVSRVLGDVHEAVHMAFDGDSGGMDPATAIQVALDVTDEVISSLAGADPRVGFVLFAARAFLRRLQTYGT